MMRAASLAALFLTLAGPAFAADEAAERGKEIFDHWCAMCHGGGNGMGATQILEERYRGSVPALLEERADLDPEFIKSFIRDWNPGMPPFRRTEISDADADALARYLARNNPKEE